jgi:hypothetical protein
MMCLKVFSCGMEAANVMRYSTPPARAIFLIGSIRRGDVSSVRRAVAAGDTTAGDAVVMVFSLW